MPSDDLRIDMPTAAKPVPPPPRYVGLKLQHRFERMGEISLNGWDDGIFHVDRSPFVLKWYFRRSQHKRLYVLLHGGANRERVPVPIFARWNYGRILPGHLLSIADPTMELSPDLRCGWYLGTELDDATPMIADLVQAIAADLGIAGPEIAFYGSSAGAFSALLIARRVRGATCLVKNPLLDIAFSGRGHRAQIAEVFSPGHGEARLLSDNRHRASVLEAFDSISDFPLTVWAQDTNDPYIERHFYRFCDRYEVDRTPGVVEVAGRFMIFFFESKSGHSEESPEIVQRLIREHLRFTSSSLLL